MPFQASKMGSASLMFRSTLRTSSTRSLSPTARALSYWREVSKSGLTITSEPLLGQTWASVQLLTQWWVSLLDQVTYLSNEIRLFLQSESSCTWYVTVLVQIDFNPLGGPSTKIIKGANSTSGDSNGLSLVIDTEAYDHGYTAAAGLFFKSTYLSLTVEKECHPIEFTNTLSDRHGGQYCSPSPWWPASPDDWKD